VVLSLTAVAAVSGCGAFDTPKARPCAWLERQAEPADSSTRQQTVVLVDRSSSTRPGTNTSPGHQSPDWAATLLDPQQMTLPALEGGILSMAGFDGNRSTVDWAVSSTFVTPVKGNETRRKDQQRARSECLKERLRQLAAEEPGTDRTDVLGALAAASDRLGTEGGRRRIYVATDGLTNTGCADLRSSGFDGTAEIKATVERCRKTGELPDLKGTEVHLVGIGQPARGDKPSSAQTAWLIALWTRLCEATGASPCKVTAITHDDETGHTTGTGKPEPAVTFPALSERSADRVTTIVLPGSILFATDRAELSQDARDTLDKAARRIKELDPVSVTVSGHTDSRGSEQHGRQLSRARAQAVRKALAQRGITVISARGYSDDRPRCTPEYHDGVPDYAAMACNRRVEIAVTVRR
jgi:outer membrane protein OmpA-like peptidoglycan-associated protein